MRWLVAVTAVKRRLPTSSGSARQRKASGMTQLRNTMPTSLAASCGSERGHSKRGHRQEQAPSPRRAQRAQRAQQAGHARGYQLLAARQGVRRPGCGRRRLGVQAAARLRQEAALLLGPVVLLAEGTQDAATQGAVGDEGVKHEHHEACMPWMRRGEATTWQRRQGPPGHGREQKQQVFP